MHKPSSSAPHHDTPHIAGARFRRPSSILPRTDNQATTITTTMRKVFALLLAALAGCSAASLRSEGYYLHKFEEVRRRGACRDGVGGVGSMWPGDCRPWPRGKPIGNSCCRSSV